MKIGFDGKRAMFNFTGLGNYSRYILEILSKYYPENEYDVFVSKRQNNKRLDTLINKYSCIKIIPANPSGRHFPAIWRTWGITKQLKRYDIDIYHGLSNELPANILKSKIKDVVTIHDLIFLRFPDCYPIIDRKIYSYKFRKACIHADHIIAVSECTKKDITDFFHIPENKISIIYQGCDHSFTLPATEEKKKMVRRKYQLPKRYILNVGRIEKRKNVMLAVKAMPKLPEELHLVIVGHRTEYTNEIEKYVHKNKLDGRVHIKSNVSFADLPAMYQQSELFVYPSLYEGFGIPIVEALNSGIPVIAAESSCLEEAGGPSSIYVKSDDVDAMTNAVMEIIYSPTIRKNMIEEGKEYAERFSEKLQAEKLMQLYTRIYNKKP